MKRTTLLILAVILGILGFWWLDTQLMPYQAWATYHEHWTLTATGWATLLHAWPVGLAGLLAGSWTGLVIGGWLGNQAAQRDLTDQQQAAQQAQVQARTHHETATAAYTRAVQMQRAATQAKVQAKQAQAHAEARLADLTAQTQARLAEAETRRRNAAGTAERRRRKLERLQVGPPKAPS